MAKGPDGGPSEWPNYPVPGEGHASPGMHPSLLDSRQIPQLVSLHFILHRATGAAYTIFDPVILLLSNLPLSNLTSHNSPPASRVSDHLESLLRVPLCSALSAQPRLPPGVISASSQDTSPVPLSRHVPLCLSDTLPPLFACEEPEGRDCGFFASVCSQAPREGLSPAQVH